MTYQFGVDTYNECVDDAINWIGSQELWIFEDNRGRFHSIQLVNGKETFNHYANTNKWIPRGRVFTETKVTTMYTGVVLDNELE